MTFDGVGRLSKGRRVLMDMIKLSLLQSSSTTVGVAFIDQYPECREP